MTPSPADPHDGADATFDMVWRLRLPLRTVSLTNQRTHWAVKARRAKAERATVQTMWRACRGRDLYPGEEAIVWLRRVAPLRLDDDNVRGAMKSIRDQIAAELGVDDRSERVAWIYEQRKGKPKEYAVEVEVRYSRAARPCACTGAK